MRLFDQHLHSRYSVDSEADPVEVVRAAIDRGLAGVSFTDHFDTHPSEWPTCGYDYQEIAQMVAELREQFGSEIEIGHGIEVCYQPAEMERILEFIENHRFDVVLLSVHWFQGRALHMREHWEGLDAVQGSGDYLQAVLDAVRFARALKQEGRHPFDILGHLDLVKRYTHRYYQTFDIAQHGSIIDDILRTALEAEIIPEVNLSTLRQGLPEPSPGLWVIRRYADLGGTAMSLGSDAHVPEHVGAHLHEGVAMLKQNGIDRLAIFKKRQCCQVDISSLET